MSKNLFQRLLALLFVLIVIFIDIPSVFKDLLIIILSIALFLSTYNILKRKKKTKEGILD
jgi:L-asparagine transporter-like permease